MILGRANEVKEAEGIALESRRGPLARVTREGRVDVDGKVTFQTTAVL